MPIILNAYVPSTTFSPLLRRRSEALPLKFSEPTPFKPPYSSSVSLTVIRGNNGSVCGQYPSSRHTALPSREDKKLQLVYPRRRYTKGMEKRRFRPTTEQLSRRFDVGHQYNITNACSGLSCGQLLGTQSLVFE